MTRRALLKQSSQGVFRPDFSALVSDWVGLCRFDDVSQCRAKLCDHQQKPPEILPPKLNGIKGASHDGSRTGCRDQRPTFKVR